MGVDSGIYNVLLVLHILAVVAGFGGLVLNGFYGAQARQRRGTEGLAVAQANLFVTKSVAHPFVYFVFVTGILLVVTSDGTWSFGDLWVSLSMGIYVLAMGLSHGLMLPTVTRMTALMQELTEAGPPPPQGATGGPPPQAVELEQRGRTVAAVGAALNLLLVAILALMVWKPV